ncbi:MAG: hypothetical protein HOH64_06975 [Rhodospirillales bacterium]|nr:hypothetical protein [Rhodospirillales bacterium]
MQLMTIFRTIAFLFLSLIVFSANAQVANDTATQQAIIQALPEGVTAESATADEIAQSALDFVFSMEGNRQANMTQVMVSLGELTRSGTFKNAPRFGDKNPPGRFYNRVLNLASSALDVTYTTYHGVTVQHIMELTAGMREGQNFLNGAKSDAITRK